jgi:hypothetical protein
MKIFHSQKKILFFIKNILEKKSSLSHRVTKDKKIDPSPFSTHPIPHHQKNIIWKIQKIPASYLENQPNFSFPCHLRNKCLG